MGQDNSIYRDYSSRLDAVGSFNPGTIDFWNAVRAANRDFSFDNNFDVDKFSNWFLENWGVQLHLTDGGFYNQDIEIVDHDKYLMFLLKYIK